MTLLMSYLLKEMLSDYIEILADSSDIFALVIRRWFEEHSACKIASCFLIPCMDVLIILSTRWWLRLSPVPCLQICPRAPSTNNSMPVVKLLSSEALGLPSLPIGMVFKRVFFISWTCCPFSNSWLMPAESIEPGLIALTQISRCFKLTVQKRANDCVAALVAL